MTADRNFRGVRSELTWGEEIPVEQALTGGTVTLNTVTGLSGMVVNKYAGQVATVVPTHAPASSADALKFHIVSNTATVLTFEETAAGTGLAATDRLVITQRNETPVDLGFYFGHVEESEMPERKIEPFKGFYKGSDNMPYAHEIIPMKVSYEASIPIRVVNGKLLYLAMGHVEDSAYTTAQTCADTTKTITNPTVPGQSTVTSTAHGLGASPGYFQFGTTGDACGPEIRYCALATNTLTCAVPLRREHPALAKIYGPITVGTGYIIHTLKIGDQVPYFSLKRTFYNYKTNVLTNDYCKIYRGLKAKSLELSIAPGDAPLQASMSVSGLSISDAEVVREATIDKAGYTNLSPYIYKGAVTKINDIIYRQAGEMSGSIDREMETKYYSEIKPQTNDQTYGYLDPSEHLEGLVNANFNVTIPLHNTNFWLMLKNMTNLGIATETSHTLTRGTNDDMAIRFYNPLLIEGSEPLPRGGEVPLNLQFEASHPIITVKDQMYFY